MLTIRQQQIEAFRPSLESQFLMRVVRWIAGKYPVLAAGPDGPAELERRVRAAYARGRRYGFRTKRDAARFVEFDAKLGEDFEKQPGNEWMRPILTHEGLSAATRLYRVECRLERLAAMATLNAEDNNAGSG